MKVSKNNRRKKTKQNQTRISKLKRQKVSIVMRILIQSSKIGTNFTIHRFSTLKSGV